MERNKIISLRPLSDEDIERYISLSDDPELIDTMGWTPFLLHEKERFRLFTEVISVPGLTGKKSAVFSIICSKDQKSIGYVSVKGISKDNSKAEVGIAIIDKDYRNRGYGTAALRQAAIYAFTELRIKTLYLTVFPSNTRAIRSYEKLGFHKVELLKNAWVMPSGDCADIILMSLHKDHLLEW